MITLWNDVPALASIENVFDDVMRSALGTRGAAVGAQTFQPAVDVRADEDKIVLDFDLPGVKQDDLEMTLERSVLTLKGARKLQSAGSNQRVLLGRAYGGFTCSYELPEGTDAERMTATLAEGVLTVTIPKLPQAKPRRVPIAVGSETKQLDR